MFSMNGFQPKQDFQRMVLFGLKRKIIHGVRMLNLKNPLISQLLLIKLENP